MSNDEDHLRARLVERPLVPITQDPFDREVGLRQLTPDSIFVEETQQDPRREILATAKEIVVGLHLDRVPVEPNHLVKDFDLSCTGSVYV